jgi:hypothetical protein
MEFTFLNGGEISVNHFKISGNPSSSIQKGVSRNPGERVSTNKDDVMYKRGMSGQNANTYGTLKNVL